MIQKKDVFVALWESTEKGDVTFASNQKKTLVFRPTLLSNQGSWFLQRYVPKKEGPDGRVFSINRAVGGRRWRGREIVNEKREKNRAKNGSLRNALVDLKEAKEEETPAEISLRKRAECLSPKPWKVDSSKDHPVLGMGLLNSSEIDGGK